MRWLGILFLFLSLTAGCGRSGIPAANTGAAPALDERATDLLKKKETQSRFFRPMQIRAGDWLESHPEDGETFEQYLRSNPTLPTDTRKTIYIQPVGDFTPLQLKVIFQTADYMRAFFNLPV